ncbi:MAG: NADH-quinone oxidoreductase subunit M [Gammaproteobacteria bacterium]|nr:NADH-quinone oxidoreductase subunit M [Gammaproteobacteria bacterium]MBU2477740.1 NADH-quinone oxidoreductase subunit M [Gammaproteobacteria bacterium]
MLRILLALPLAGALLVLLLPGRAGQLIRWVAIATTLATVVLAVFLTAGFDPARSDIQYFQSHVWNPRLGGSFALGVDGISLPLVLLSTVLCLVAIIASHTIRERIKAYYLLMLLLQAPLLGVFTARDWSLFYVFWELTLIPLLFLINYWGGEQRQRAALNFVIYTMGGSVFMLITLLALYDMSAGQNFGMQELELAAHSLPVATQTILFAGLFIGFGVKMPVVPMHGWLPLAHVEAPIPVSILLSGILLKMGSYGMIRAAGLLPDAVQLLSQWLAAAAIVSILYGAVLAWRQSDIKAMIAYSSVSHMGVVLFALATLSTAGMTGAVMQMVAHGLVAGMLFLFAGLLYDRVHTRDLNDIGVLTVNAPRLAFVASFAFIAAIGLPGSVGFVAELHTFYAGLASFGAWVALFGIGILISSSYALRTIGHLLVGTSGRPPQQLTDLSRTEAIAVSILGTGILVLGIWPAPALTLMQASVENIAGLFVP